ncbi:MAG: hypothetical protein R8J94_07865 [Acidimicrobiia bacterium]|nr:hypothetical protein [Acidimicrobiia bacterium]
MFWSFVSPKGGVGVSVVAASVAAVLSKEQPVTLVDFCGDQPAIFGVGDDEAQTQGVHEWLAADSSVTPEALSNLEIEVTDALRIIPAGSSRCATMSAERCTQLVAALRQNRTVIADVGVLSADPVAPRSLVCAAGDQTTIVLRACYLALQRVRACPVVLDHVVELVEGGRSLRTIDIEAVLGQPVTSRLPVDPVVARAVDAGLIARRIPRQLRRAVEDLRAESPARAVAR